MKRIPFYALLFPLYVVLALMAHNLGEMEPLAVWRPSLVAILIGATLWVAFRLLWKDNARAGLAALLVSLLLFSYGHIYELLKELGPSLASVVRHRYLLPLLTVMIATALFSLWRRTEIPQGLTLYLNVSMSALILLPIAQTAFFFAHSTNLAEAEPAARIACSSTDKLPDTPPDVYLIVMDAYERDDVLDELHGYDNSPFIRWLQSHGFYVARGSMSNYRHTELSIASILNLDYVQSFPDRYSENSNNRMGIISMISDNRLRRELECLGYTTVAFDSGLFWTKWEDVDYFISPTAGPFDNANLLGRLSPFESLLLETSIGRVYVDASLSLKQGNPNRGIDKFTEQRDLIRYSFSQLPLVPELPAPKLVFVHILSPHPPFLFGPDGTARSQAEFDTIQSGTASDDLLLEAYADQVHYLNGQLELAIGAILEKSENPPIIILQGDHGWAERGPEDKLSILNAYHLPWVGSSPLYPTITPVNSFRLVLNTYFGADYDLLPDVSYFSSEKAVFKFEPIENTWESSN